MNRTMKFDEIIFGLFFVLQLEEGGSGLKIFIVFFNEFINRVSVI